MRDEGDVNRREFLRWTAGLGSLLALPSVDPDIAAPLVQPTIPDRLFAVPTDDIIVISFEQILAALWQAEFAISNQDLLPGVAGLLDTLTKLLDRPLQPSVRRQLTSIAGEIAALVLQRGLQRPVPNV
jgi:hypothetical protein